MPPLVSAQTRIEKTQKRRMEFTQQLIDAFNPQDHPTAIELRAKPVRKSVSAPDMRPWTAVTVCFASVPKADEELGIAVGEVIHHYRAALDHAVWELVRRGRRRALTAREALSVEFPMARKRKNTVKELDRKMPGTSTEVRAIIEDYQPYRRTKIGRAIRRLGALSNTDKHRTILPTGAFPSGEWGFDIDVIWTEVQSTDLLYKRNEEFRVGTKIARLILVGGIEVKDTVKVKGELSPAAIFPRAFLSPSRDDPPAFVGDTLDEIDEACCEVIARLEREP